MGTSSGKPVTSLYLKTSPCSVFSDSALTPSQCDQIGRFFTLGNHSKLVATIILPKLPKLLDNFCKGVKIINFSSEMIFGKLL